MEWVDEEHLEQQNIIIVIIIISIFAIIDARLLSYHHLCKTIVLTEKRPCVRKLLI